MRESLSAHARARRPAPPLLDAFGTRVEARAVLDGLRKQGLGRFSLKVLDRGLVLRVPSRGVSEDCLARSVTWLKGVFSPLMPCRVERAGPGGPRSVALCAVREVVTSRTLPLHTVALAEVWSKEGFGSAWSGILKRLGAGSLPDPRWAGRGLARGVPCARSLPAQGRQPLSLRWFRPGGPRGVRPAHIVAGSFEREALDWLARALCGAAPETGSFQVLLDGLEWGVGRRPTIAAPADAGGFPIAVDKKRCRDCGLCAGVCPAGCLASGGRFRKGKARACLGCFDCVEACPQDALRPVYGPSSATLSSALLHRPLWLSRLAGRPGPAQPALFTPSFLLPKSGPRGKFLPDPGWAGRGLARGVPCASPLRRAENDLRLRGRRSLAARPRLSLGLAITTLQEHAAALVRDGRPVEVSAVEEERFSRVRHHGWHAPGRPGVSIAVDPTLSVEEAFPREAIAALLGPGRSRLDDVDLIAVNGLPARYRRAFSADVVGSGKPLPTLRAGRVVYVPHHLAHAASAWRAGGLQDAWVLTVDGRGDRETAAVFRGRRGALKQVLEVPSLTDRSIGGVYETVTRLLGFGAHGQGSVMALASFGKPRYDLTPFLSWRGSEDYSIHETGVTERFASLARSESDPLTRKHQDLAASLQAALEDTIIALLKSAGVKPGAQGLCLAGGVALNCRLNQRLREVFRPRRMFVQPGANDAGTALGAVLEALHLAGADKGFVMEHALLGPRFTGGEMRSALRRAKTPFRVSKDAPGEAARRLAAGEVVCWFDGRLEFGPRALGSRSILADPRRPDLKDRVNRMKGREPWRPFGPSVLSGAEQEWFEGASDSRFMLFTVPLKAGKAAEVPAVVHVDGTSRPQVVRREHQPRYFDLIRGFRDLTGVPMILNTSFNRRGEPIVRSPDEALECFLAMGADCLFLGDFAVEKRRA